MATLHSVHSRAELKMINNDKASHFIINQFVHKWQKIVTTSQLLKVDNDAKKKQIVFYKTC